MFLMDTFMFIDFCTLSMDLLSEILHHLDCAALANLMVVNSKWKHIVKLFVSKYKKRRGVQLAHYRYIHEKNSDLTCLKGKSNVTSFLLYTFMFLLVASTTLMKNEECNDTIITM